MSNSPSTPLLTLDQIREELSKTEPLSSTLISDDTKVSFNLGDTWSVDDSVGSITPVHAFVTINGVEHAVGREAIFQAGAHFGLTAAYMKRAPASLIQPHLNYWYSAGMDGQMFSALHVGDSVRAITSHKHVPFSNLDILDRVVNELDPDSEEFFQADWKFTNSLVKTDIRLLLGYPSRVLATGDTWSAGVHISNSLIGKTMTSVEPYLYNESKGLGATGVDDLQLNWNRRLDGVEELDMLDWVGETAVAVHKSSMSKLDQIEKLSTLPVPNISEATREVFDRFKIAQKSRRAVIDAIVSTPGDELTMYSIMEAILKGSNDPELTDAKRDALMRAGGALPSAHFDTVKAKVYSEGQSNPKGPNPYVIPSA